MKAQFQPKVSVVIPTFNRPSMLTHAIKSVLAQSETDLEVVVVDDASDASTRAAVEAIGDDRITYVRNNRNLGESHSRNAGVECARGRYVGFLDDDDEWLPQKVQHQLKSLSTVDDAVWVYSGWQWVNRTSGTTTVRRTPDPSGRIDGLPRWAYNVAVDFLCRRDVLLTLPYDHTLRYYEACDLVLRLSMKYKATFVPDVLVTCHTHGGPRTSDRGADVKVRALDVLFQRYAGFMKHDPRGWARFNLILGALYSRELKDGRHARGPLKEAIRARPWEWHGWAYFLYSSFVS